MKGSKQDRGKRRPEIEPESGTAAATSTLAHKHQHHQHPPQLPKEQPTESSPAPALATPTRSASNSRNSNATNEQGYVLYTSHCTDPRLHLDSNLSQKVYLYGSKERPLCTSYQYRNSMNGIETTNGIFSMESVHVKVYRQKKRTYPLYSSGT